VPWRGQLPHAHVGQQTRSWDKTKVDRLVHNLVSFRSDEMGSQSADFVNRHFSLIYVCTSGIWKRFIALFPETSFLVHANTVRTDELSFLSWQASELCRAP
jgi:hypothetical protein